MMIDLKTKIIVLSVFAFFLIAANSVNGCQCVPTNLESAIKNSSNIALVKLQSIETEDDSGDLPGRVRQYVFTVERKFKGGFRTGQVLPFERGNSCGWNFSEEDAGAQYLFFLGDKPNENNLWSIPSCSRSSDRERAAGDLLYFEKMPKVAGKTRLSGRLILQRESAVEDEDDIYEVLPGRNIVLSRNGRNIKLKTDENGIYEIYDLPAGKYTVTPEKISGYKFNYQSKDSEVVEIKAGRIIEKEIYYQIDNSISGRLFDATGRALANVDVSLISAGGKKSKYWNVSGGTTDEDGAFIFEAIPPGTYRIVVNEDNKISADNPFGTFYYPGKTKREEAAEINIGAGDHFKDLVMTAPETAETVQINGTLLFEDGKSVSKGIIEFYNNFESLDDASDSDVLPSITSTDENGKFTIKTIKGQKGILVGAMFTFLGEYENCPKLDSLMRETDNSIRIQNIRTAPIKISADDNINQIVFKFPFPGCKKSKLE